MVEHQKFCEEAADARLDQLTLQLNEASKQLSSANAAEKKAREEQVDVMSQLVKSKEAR